MYRTRRLQENQGPNALRPIIYLKQLVYIIPDVQTRAYPTETLQEQAWYALSDLRWQLLSRYITDEIQGGLERKNAEIDLLSPLSQDVHARKCLWHASFIRRLLCVAFLTWAYGSRTTVECTPLDVICEICFLALMQWTAWYFPSRLVLKLWIPHL